MFKYRETSGVHFSSSKIDARNFTRVSAKFRFFFGVHQKSERCQLAVASSRDANAPGESFLAAIISRLATAAVYQIDSP